MRKQDETEIDIREPHDDGMNESLSDGWFDTFLIWPLVAVTALFKGAEWALEKCRVVWTALIALILSLGWI